MPRKKGNYERGARYLKGTGGDNLKIVKSKNAACKINSKATYRNKNAVL